jgi:probable HAF family extracellular repeat protein
MMTDLGTLPGDFVSWAETINNSGQAVGASFDASGNSRPVVWEDGAMADLNRLIPPGSPWVLLQAPDDDGSLSVLFFACIARSCNPPASIWNLILAFRRRSLSPDHDPVFTTHLDPERPYE